MTPGLPRGTLGLAPITLREANAFVQLHHRHHKPVRGCIVTLAVADGTGVRGVAIVGRPVARRLQDSWTAEVTRVCTDTVCTVKHDREHPKEGCSHHACSMLYGAAWRAVKALGYKRLVTYTLPTESGASLRAAGWVCIGEAGGGNWNVQSRPRVDSEHQQLKLRWEAA
jgi:hypothetical protein